MDLDPGFLVFLKGIDFHPAFEDRNGVRRVASVDEFLDHVSERGLDEAAGFVEAGLLIPLLRRAVTIGRSFRAFLGKQRYSDELAMCLFSVRPWPP